MMAVSPTPRPPATVASYIATTLRLSGVEIVFGYPGQSNLVLLDAIRRAGIRLVLTADERSAGFAAAGYIQATGRPAVVCASKGPGTTNLLTPLVAAKLDGVPVVALTGNLAVASHGRNSFQEFHPSEVFRDGVAKSVLYESDPRAVPAVLARSVAVAWTEPYGPVLLDIPYTTLTSASSAEPAAIERPAPRTRVLDPDSVTALQRASELMAVAQRPVLIAGAGARRDYLAVRACAARLSTPVLHTMGGTGVIGTDDVLYGGLLRHNGNPMSAYLAQKADLVLALGTGLDHHATGDPSRFAAGATIVHVDLDARVPGRSSRVDLAVHESVGAFVSAFSRLMPEPLTHPAWLREVAEWRERDPARVPDTAALAARELVDAARPALLDAIVVKDSGAHKYWVTKYGPCLMPQHAIASCHFGTMGFGLPAAIGAALGMPDKRVVCVCGDGGLLMALPDLITAGREGCDNLTILVFNNGGLGSTRDYERRVCQNGGCISDYGRHMPLHEIARALGVRASRIDARSDLGTLPALMQRGGLALIDCVLDQFERLSPSVPYTEPLDHLLAQVPEARLSQ